MTDLTGRLGHGETAPAVRGVCPACGEQSLFLADDGSIFCTATDCTEPDAAAIVLNGRPAVDQDDLRRMVESLKKR